MGLQTRHFYTFGPFRLDSQERVLLRDGEPVSVNPKALETLLILVKNAGHLVDKEELMRQVWPDTFVEEGNLNKNIFFLRKVLGPVEEGREYIETVPRRGYRFAAKVQIRPYEAEGSEVTSSDDRFEIQAPTAKRETSARVERIDRARAYANATQPEPVWEEPEPAAAPASPTLWHLLIAASLLALMLTVGVLLFVRSRQPSPSGSVPELKQWQLTDNSSENAVTSGAVSPDGRYLAYADHKGLHVKLIETGETADVRQPEELSKLQVNWRTVPTWVRDGTRFIANANLPGHRSSIWIVPVIGGTPRKIRDDSEAYSVSRDGSWVAYMANWDRLGYREVWAMTPDGARAHKLHEVAENHAFAGAEWSPDDRRLAYLIAHEASTEGGVTLEVRDLKGGPAVTVLANADAVEDYAWLPDGRIVYSSDDPGPPAANCNLWSVPTDHDGKPTGKPKRLTNWAGFCLDAPSPSADSGRLTFRRWAWRANVYLAELDPTGNHITTPRQLTLTEGRNFPAAWTADSKAVILQSYRDRQWQLLKHSLTRDTAEPLVSVTDQMWNALGRLSPDGSWILYPGAYTSSGGDAQPYQLLRVPVTGGPSQPVLKATFYDSIQSRTAPGCARAPANLCAIAERSSDGKQITFTAFDPLKGRGPEIIRVEAQPASRDYIWDLSPDGSRIALLELTGTQPAHSSAGHQIRLIPVNGRPSQKLVVKGWDNLQSVDWAADGKALFVSAATPDGSALLHVDLEGNARVLWKHKGGAEPWFALAPWAVPSPDGRHLAIYDWSLSANMWMMENF
jgi:DNA-binding winged helix-turn-helix (wHTH) protein/Tol biopolymer transport system component